MSTNNYENRPGSSECTGYLDPKTGTIQHDGDTCPIHEAAE